MIRNWFSSFQSSPKRNANRAIQLEQLEARMLCTASACSDGLGLLDEYSSAAAIYSSGIPGETNSARPSVASPISVKGGNEAPITTSRISLSTLGADDGGERQLSYRWELVSKPTGSRARFSSSGTNSAKRTNLTIDSVGTYRVQVTIADREGKTVKATQTIRVTPVLKSVALINGNRTLRNGATISTSAKSQSLVLQAFDQFGKPMSLPAGTNWQLTASPTGSSPSLNGSGSRASMRFDQAGKYKFQVTNGSTRYSATVNVTQTLTRITASTDSSTIEPGARAKFSVQGADQFGNVMTRVPGARWSVSGGAKISSNGQFTAPAKLGTYSIVANIGTLRTTASIRVAEIPQSSEILALTQSYFADGSISRADMMAILRSAGDDGVVNSLELSQLRSVVGSSTQYAMPDYVKVLASNVVNSNPANSRFQGVTLGNLAAGSSVTQLNKLVDKWFVGADLPTLAQVAGAGTIAYATASGSLFSGTPSLNDQKQGLIGDCYLISSLGSLAMQNPAAVENMFIDNGDGTFTVRFYNGTLNAYSSGFVTGAGTADYVTVDLRLPAYANGLYFAYSNFGQLISSGSNSLWIALAEKAYAQWNETGRAGQNGQNSYAGIEGGWMGIVYAQILGYNATNYSLSSGASKTTLINALNARYAVTIGTNANAPNLVQGHAYSVTAYDSGTDRFTLFNPWGTSHPAGPMTWAELQANCDFFALIDPSGTVSPRNGAVGGSSSFGLLAGPSYQFEGTYSTSFVGIAYAGIADIQPASFHEIATATHRANNGLDDAFSSDDAFVTKSSQIAREYEMATSDRNAMLDAIFELETLEELLADLAAVS